MFFATSNDSTVLGKDNISLNVQKPGQAVGKQRMPGDLSLSALESLGRGSHNQVVSIVYFYEW